MKYYAHSLPGEPPEEWQLLEDHLKNVADMARGFAEEFGAGDWACLALLLHDGGNTHLHFKRYWMERIKEGTF